jgi:hypothetical protein
MRYPSLPASELASLLSAVICAAVLFVAEVAAQSTLTTTFASNNGGSVGGMVFFDVSVTNPVGVTVKKFDINTTSTGGELQVFVTPTGFTGVAATPLAWTHVASGVLVPAGMDNPSEVCLGAGFHLAPGSYGFALTAPTISHRYTNGGPGVPLSVSNADLAVAIGAAANAPFGGAQFMPRLWNGTVHYDLGQTSAFSCAYTRSFGAGCNEGATTWYQHFSDLSSFDLAGSLQVPIAVRATVAGPVGYIVLPATPAWYAPSGAALADNVSSNPGVITTSEFSEPIVLPFTFSFPGGSTNTVHASANGWVRLGATTQTFDGSLPAVHTLLTQDARLAPLWSLMDPSANAATNSATGIYYDIDPNGQAVYITWLDVADARTGSPPAGTTSINVQCVIYSNGSYEFRYGHVLIGSGTGPAIVGWSKGGIASPVPDPGSIDVSSSMPLLTNGPDNFALEHVVGTARLGSTLDLAVDRVEPLAPFAFLIVGNVENTAGQPLLGVGAPGCSVFTNTLAAAAVPVSGATGSGAFVIGIPSIPALVGTTFVSQYAALTQRNALNLSTSNGVSWTIGN